MIIFTVMFCHSAAEGVVAHLQETRGQECTAGSRTKNLVCGWYRCVRVWKDDLRKIWPYGVVAWKTPNQRVKRSFCYCFCKAKARRRGLLFHMHRYLKGDWDRIQGFGAFLNSAEQATKAQTFANSSFQECLRKLRLQNPSLSCKSLANYFLVQTIPCSPTICFGRATFADANVVVVTAHQSVVKVSSSYMLYILMRMYVYIHTILFYGTSCRVMSCYDSVLQFSILYHIV